MKAELVQAELRRLATPQKAKASAWFFKTGPGQYGEGDKFIGVTVPQQRMVAKTFSGLPLDEVVYLLQSPVHEDRLTALFILVIQYQKSDPAGKKQIASLYHKNRAYVNNWDLVDSSAPYILGDYLTKHSRAVLYRLARSKKLWDRRIAIISTAAFIRSGDFGDTLALAELLLNDKEDLMHKAVGWMLREVGKKDRSVLVKFLDQHAAAMPRTALRYAIEHFDAPTRQAYLAKR